MSTFLSTGYQPLYSSMVMFKRSANQQNASKFISEGKKEQLERACSACALDLVCVQETKVPDYDELNLSSGHKLILMQQETAKFCGLGFVIGPRLIPHVHSWWYVSDRVAVIKIAIPNRGGKFTESRVINAYGPTMQKATDNPAVRDRFYADLSSAVAAPSCFQVFACGDFNSKLGQLTPQDEEAGLNCCICSHGKGTRNSNGEALIQFLLHHGMFACNTAFQHASHRKTSWTAWV